MPKAIKKDTALAAALLSAGIDEGDVICVIRPPAITLPDNVERTYSNKSMFGIQFKEGVGVTTDVELAQRCIREFPEYSLTITNADGTPYEEPETA